TRSEPGGVEALWKLVEPHTDSARWEETLRLLIASLKSTESRRLILERLTDQLTSHPTLQRASLMAGCFIDTIEEVEALADETAAASIASVLSSNDTVSLSKTAPRLIGALLKSESLREGMERRLQEILDTSTSPMDRCSVLLFSRRLGIALGW